MGGNDFFELDENDCEEEGQEQIIDNLDYEEEDPVDNGNDAGQYQSQNQVDVARGPSQGLSQL